MSKTTRRLSKEILERIEGQPPSNWGAGNEVVETTITYRKDARVRGYYLHVHTYRELAEGGTMHSLFTAPSKYHLLQETKMFSAKKLETMTPPQLLIDETVAVVKTEYWESKKREEEQAARRATA